MVAVDELVDDATSTNSLDKRSQCARSRLTSTTSTTFTRNETASQLKLTGVREIPMLELARLREDAVG